MSDEAPKLQVETIKVENIPEPGAIKAPDAGIASQIEGVQAVQDFFGIASPSEDQKEKLGFIWKEVGKGRSREETLEEIKNIRYRLSPPDLGESYVHKMYAYIRLMAEGRSIERERKAYESNNFLDDSRP